MSENIPSFPFGGTPQPQDQDRAKAQQQSSRLFSHPDRDSILSDQNYPPKQRPASRQTKSVRRELRLKHSELRRNILIIISVIIGLLLALIATDTIKLGTGPRPYLSDKSQSFGSQRRTSLQVSQTHHSSIRQLTPTAPLRVYIGGDSLVGSYGNELATQLGESGVIKAIYDSQPSSGLVNTDFFNWNSHMRDISSRYNPEIIIFMIGTNDASIVSSNPKGYLSQYTKKIDFLLDTINTKDRQVIFVLAPAMKNKKLNTNLDKINDVIYNVVSKRNIPTIESGLTLSPNGIFTTSINNNGRNIIVRTSDGIHITQEGGNLLALAIGIFLENYLNFSQYAQGPPIKPSKVPGCCTSPKRLSLTSSEPTRTNDSITIPSSSIPNASEPTSTTSSSIPEQNNSSNSINPDSYTPIVNE